MVCATADPISAGPISAALAMNASEILCHEVMGLLRERFVAADYEREATKISARIVLLRCTLVKATAGACDFDADVCSNPRVRTARGEGVTGWRASSRAPRCARASAARR